MKYIYCILSLFSLLACSENIDELNENIKNPETITGEALFTSGQKNLVDQMTNSSVNNNVYRLFAQHWTETVYTDETRYEIINRNIPGNNWRIMYRDVLSNLSAAKISLEQSVTTSENERRIKDNKIAITEILIVYAFSVLVETYGDIPYTEALNTDIKLPKFDDGLTVYLDLLERLDNAILVLNEDSGSFGASDNIYSGVTSSWFKFANSLKLRMSVILSYAPGQNALASRYATEVLDNVFQSNDDNAAIKYLSSVPNANQLFVDLVASGRNDFVPADTLIDYMNDLDDPRRKHYFDDNITDAEGNPVYEGGSYGNSNSYPNFTHVSTNIIEADYPGILMDYVEVEFLLTEAYELGLINGGDAEASYNRAITASFLFWGATSEEASAYLANPEVTYNSTEWREKVGNQAWVALYNRGYEAWTSWRRLDFPKLEAPEDAVSAIPVRFTYPVFEQTLNPQNYQEAAAAIGGDNVVTKLFWDQN